METNEQYIKIEKMRRKEVIRKIPSQLKGAFYTEIEKCKLKII